MTIASALTALNTDIQNARTAITNKGGTVTSGGGSSQLATDIATIPTASSPVITSLSVTPTTSAQTITAPSGTDGYSPVNVSAVTSSIDANITAGNIKKNVQILGVTGTYEGSGSGYSELPNYQVENGVANKRSKTLDGTEFNDITDVGANAFEYSFYRRSGLTGILSFPSLTTVSGDYAFTHAFQSCTNLTGVSFPSLTTVSGGNSFDTAFSSCSKLTSVSFPLLATLGSSAMQSTFNGCTKLTSVSFPLLATLRSNAMSSAFYGCTSLTDLYFPSLTTTSFGSYKNQFQNMMQSTGTSKTHKIHFPSNLQATISGLTGYPLFGGSSGKVTLVFDLTATS